MGGGQSDEGESRAASEEAEWKAVVPERRDAGDENDAGNPAFAVF